MSDQPQKETTKAPSERSPQVKMPYMEGAFEAAATSREPMANDPREVGLDEEGEIPSVSKASLAEPPKADLLVEEVGVNTPLERLAKTVNEGYEDNLLVSTARPLQTERANEYLETDAPLVTEHKLINEADEEAVNLEDIIVEEKEANLDKIVIEPQVKKAKPAPTSLLEGTISRKLSMRDIYSKKKIVKVESSAQNPAKSSKCCLLGNLKFGQSRDRKLMVLGYIVSFLNGVLGASHAIVLGQLVDVFNPYNNEKEMFKNFKALFVLLLPLVGGMLLLGYLQSYLMTRSAAQCSLTLRTQLFRSLCAQDQEFFESIDHEKLPDQIQDRFSNLLTCINQKAGQLAFAMGAVCGALALCVVVSPTFTLGMALACPTLLVLYKILASCCDHKAGVLAESESKLSSLSMESLHSIRQIAASGQEAHTLKRFQDLALQSEALKWEALVSKSFNPVAGFFVLLCFVVYALGITSIYLEKDYRTGPTYEGDNKITFTEIVMCLEAFIFALIFTYVAASLSGQVSQASKSGEELIRLVERESRVEPVKTENGILIKNICFDSGIYLRSLTFRYPLAPSHAQPIFEKVALKIEGGQASAIVGERSSGKSTLLKVLNRLYNPTEGSIYAGSESNFRSCDLDIFRQRVAYVDSCPQLIPGTVKDNLLLANQRADYAEIEKALELSGASNFVDKLHKGLETVIEGASSQVELTLGQKLRLSLAKAMIQNPQLLLIDDITSQLEPAQSKQVEAALERVTVELKARPETTILFVTSQLYKLKNAENVIWIKDSSEVLSFKKEGQTYEQLKAELFADQADQEDTSYIDTEPEQEVPVTIVAKKTMIQPKSKKKAISDDLAKKQLASKKMLRSFKPRNASHSRLWSRFDDSPWKRFLLRCIIFANAGTIPCLALLYVKFFVLYFGEEYHDDNLIKRFTSYNAPLAVTEDQYQAQKRTHLGIMVPFIFVNAALQLLTGYMITSMGVTVENRARQLLLESILYKEVAWFDKQENSAKELTRIVTQDVRCLREVSVSRPFLLWEVICLCFGGLVVSAILTWRHTVFMVGVCPLIFYCSMVMSEKLMQTPASAPETRRPLSLQQQLAQPPKSYFAEAIQSFGALTTSSSANKAGLMRKYKRMEAAPANQMVKDSHLAGLLLGLAQGGRSIALILGFFIAYEFSFNFLEVALRDTLMSTLTLFLTFSYAGFKAAHLPCYEEGQLAAENIFSVIDEKSRQDVRQKEVFSTQIQFGKVEFKETQLKFPNAKDLTWDSLSLTVEAHEKVGVVGAIQSGKSAIAAVLTQFCGIQNGQVLLDDRSIEEFSANRLRSQVSYLSREPIIFNWSFAENITMGRSEIPDSEIFKAALLANALSFIEEADSETASRGQRVAQGLKDAVVNLAPSFATLQGFDQEVARIGDLDFQQMMHETLKFADMESIIYIADDPKAFLSFAQKAFASAQGHLNWYELLLMHEWELELQTVLKEGLLSEEPRKYFESFCKRNRHSFDVRSVATTLRSFLLQEQGTESLPSYVIQQRIYKFALRTHQKFDLHQKQRRETLVRSQVDKMRDPRGVFCLSKGFGRLCGEKGRNLTLSQKQRIALARAILSDPKILILDEVTRGLDEQGRVSTEKAIENATQGRTSIVLTQDEHMLQKCDTVYVLGEKGKIRGKGAFSALEADPDSCYNSFKAGN